MRPFATLFIVGSLVAMLSTPSAVRAQLCNGQIRVTLLADSDTVDFVIDSAVYEPAQFSARRLVSRDGSIAVRALPAEEDYFYPDAILRLLYGQRGFMVRSGCGNDITMTFVRTRGAVADTMVVAAENACDVSAGLTLDFEPGRFSTVVCDTTRFPAATTEGWRFHPMPYVGSRWDGVIDATPALTREDAPPALDSLGRRRLVRLVDRLGRPVDHPDADVRARLLPAAWFNPRWRGPRTHVPNEEHLPDRFVWQRLRRSEESGIHVLAVEAGIPEDRVVELWVRIPGCVWWGPMPIEAWGRAVKPGRHESEITLTIDRGSSTELAPFNGMEIRYDYFSRLVVVPIDESVGDADTASLRRLPGVEAVLGLESSRARGRVGLRSLILQLDRDLLAFDDPLLERLRADRRTAGAGPAVRADPNGYGISAPGDRLVALPRRFTVYSDEPATVLALAERLGVGAISIDPREMRWEIVAPPGTGNAVAAFARSFAAVRGIRSVELYIGPADMTPPLD